MGYEYPVCKSEGKRVLLVEGANDCHFIMAIYNQNRMNLDFGIYDCESDVKVLMRLNALISAPDPLEVIGVVLDADKPDVAGRWQSIQSKLKDYPYVLPPAPLAEGTIIPSTDEFPKLGFWLMPDNREIGMLEDFCIAMISEEAKAVAARCVEIAKTEGVATFKTAHHSKAVLHTYLACQNEPGDRLGVATNRHSLRPGSEIALVFAEWINELFSSA